MIGTGYVGLVSGVCFSDLGNQVICVDKDLTKIKKLQSGIIPIYEPGLDELVQKNVKNNRLKFSNDLKNSIKKSDIIFICVGTPTKKGGSSADLSQISSVAKEVSKSINRFKSMSHYYQTYRLSQLISQSSSESSVKSIHPISAKNKYKD